MILFYHHDMLVYSSLCVRRHTFGLICKQCKNLLINLSLKDSDIKCALSGSPVRQIFTNQLCGHFLPVHYISCIFCCWVISLLFHFVFHQMTAWWVQTQIELHCILATDQGFITPLYVLLHMFHLKLSSSSWKQR